MHGTYSVKEYFDIGFVSLNSINKLHTYCSYIHTVYDMYYVIRSTLI
jgi:hypothetical protein